MELEQTTASGSCLICCLCLLSSVWFVSEVCGSTRVHDEASDFASFMQGQPPTVTAGVTTCFGWFCNADIQPMVPCCPDV